MTLPIFLASLAVSLQGLQLTPPPKPAPDKVFAKVNGVAIKASDIEAYLWDWRASEVEAELIDSELIRAEAAKKNVKVTDEEISATLKTQYETFKAGLQPGQTAEMVLKQQGFTVSRLVIKIRNQLLVDRILGTEFNPENFVKVSTMIFKAKTDSAADLSDALKRADAAYEQLQKGSSWAKVLELNETDPAIRNSGGQIGWVDYKAFTEAAAGEIRALGVTKVSKPTVTKNGIQIFKVDAQGKSASEVEKAELRQRFLGASRAQLLNRLRSEAKIERPS